MKIKTNICLSWAIGCVVWFRDERRYSDMYPYNYFVFGIILPFFEINWEIKRRNEL